MYINIAKVDFGRYDSGGEPQLNGLYITPADASAINVTPNNSYYTLHGKYLKYSLNGKKWKDWNGSVTIEPEQKMYLKGEDDYVWNSSTSGKLITANGSYNVGGDISSLTNFIAEVKEYTFYNLFNGDDYIKDASNLILPATTLANDCYESMFYYCRSLTSAPELPATKLTQGCYQSMFYGCTSLTTAPALPATKLYLFCYNSMFSGCTSLTTAPELPATSMLRSCYQYMFQGCTSLTTAPALPATSLADICYYYMFSGCSSLTTAPALPATTLKPGCYTAMFEGCSSLTTAPELPATTLADSCYDSMFSRCTSLTSAPALPATTLADSCYDSMFSRCTSLTSAPALPATTLASRCYENMFSRCTSLSAAPELHATVLEQGCYQYMFNVCTSLTTAPELHADVVKPHCYYNMFNGCTSLTTAPELHATRLSTSCYNSMFKDCSSLNSITMLATDISADGCLTDWVSGVAPTGTLTKAASMTSLPTGVNGIPEGWTVKDYDVVDYSSEYMTLSALGDGEITITIPADINSSYATSLSYSKDKSTWNETIIDYKVQTISIPVTNGDNVYLKGIAKQLGNSSTNVNINSTANINTSGNTMSLLYGDDYKDKVAFQSRSEYIFNSLFKGNTHLINAKDLIIPATTLADSCYSRMFNGCTSLTTAPELPATMLANYCYQYMFNGCTSLTTAPELPATKLNYSCYEYMFYNCSSLNNITMLATDNYNSYNFNWWVSGVSPTGTFTKSPEMTTLPTGVSGIPTGWTVVDYTAA